MIITKQLTAEDFKNGQSYVKVSLGIEDNIASDYEIYDAWFDFYDRYYFKDGVMYRNRRKYSSLNGWRTDKIDIKVSLENVLRELNYCIEHMLESYGSFVYKGDLKMKDVEKVEDLEGAVYAGFGDWYFVPVENGWNRIWGNGCDKKVYSSEELMDICGVFLTAFF